MRIAVGIEYDGSGYVGWQRQESGIGVQSKVESAIATVADDPVETVCAGRTDAGVHAEAQVVHFDTSAERTTRGWLLGINANLPDDVNATWVKAVPDDFHARFSAIGRRYRYLILNRLVRSALYRHRAWWVHAPLDEVAMQTGANRLLGEHDFSAFRAAGCQASTPIREITAFNVVRNGDWITLHVAANAFLQHMVRNLAGVLVAIGSGEQAPDWAGQVLAGRDRTAGGVAAPPQGLTLVGVDYPAAFGIPSHADGNPAVGDAR